jgi:hypothetical protein
MLSATTSTTNMPTDENVAPSAMTQHHQQQFGKADASTASFAANKLTIKQLEQHEPLLLDNPSRFVLFPIKYKDVQTDFLCPLVSIHPLDLGHVQEG